MMKFFRSQSQTVLVLVLGVIALGFLFYGNPGNLLTNPGARTSNDYGRIDGENLTVADLTDAVRNTRNTIIAHGQYPVLKKPGAAAQVAELAWSWLLLLHEADRLHITVSDKELVDHIHSVPDFQAGGVYSPKLYEMLIKRLQTALHMPSDDGADTLASTKAAFETVVRNELRINAVKTVLFSGVRGSEHDVSAQYEKLYGPVSVSYVTFAPKSFTAAAQVTPADVEAEYKAHPENPAYRTEEKRKVDYVLLLLPPDQAKLPVAQKAAAKDALGQKLLDFALAFQPEPSLTGEPPPPPDFMAEARKLGLKSATTDSFASNMRPANVPPSPAFNDAAFSLTKDDPVSKVVELDNGVAVLHLVEIQPSKLRPLDEVKAGIEQQLKMTKGTQTAQFMSQIMAKTLQSAVAKGADFTAAAEGMKLKVETFSTFVPDDIMSSEAMAVNDPRLPDVAYTTISLAPGQVSEPVPMKMLDMSMVLHLDSRAKADPAGLLAFETRFRKSQDGQLQRAVEADWTNWKSKQPGTRKPPDLEAYGSVE